MDGDILRPGWLCFQFQRLGLSEEIPIVVLDRPKTDRGLCCLCVDMLLLCLNNMLCCWRNALGNSKMDCQFVY